MSGGPWSKFFWADWESDEALKLCSPGAQALWMRMLCVCSKADGYLTIAGEKLDADAMVVLTGWPPSDVRAWWDELKRWRVFSIEGRGKVYCRRMVREAKKAETARQNGQLGGNPNLGNHSGNRASVNPRPTQRPTKRPTQRPGISQKPEARYIPPSPLEGGANAEDRRAFEKALAAYPAAGRVATKPDEAWAEWLSAVAEADGDERRLVAAVETLAGSREAQLGDGKRVPSMQRFLREGRWKAFAPVVHPRWSGPPEVRAQVAAAHGEEFAANVLDACCAFRHLPTPAVICRSGWAHQKLTRQCRSIFQKAGIDIVQITTAAA